MAEEKTPMISSGQSELDLTQPLCDLDGRPFKDSGEIVSLGLYLRGAMGRNRTERDLISVVGIGLKIDEAIKNSGKIVLDAANLETAKRVVQNDAFEINGQLTLFPAAMRGMALMALEGKK